MLSQVQFNKEFGLPRPRRTNFHKKYNGNPNGHGWKETKGYVRKMFSSLDTADSKMAGRIQRQIRRQDRRAAKKQIELGLLDYELEQEAQAYEEAEFLYEIGIDYSLGDDHTAFYTVAKAADDYMLLAASTHLKGVHCDSIIVDELDLRWQYKHEGD